MHSLAAQGPQARASAHPSGWCRSSNRRGARGSGGTARLSGWWRHDGARRTSGSVAPRAIQCTPVRVPGRSEARKGQSVEPGPFHVADRSAAACPPCMSQLTFAIRRPRCPRSSPDGGIGRRTSFRYWLGVSFVDVTQRSMAHSMRYYLLKIPSLSADLVVVFRQVATRTPDGATSRCTPGDTLRGHAGRANDADIEA